MSRRHGAGFSIPHTAGCLARHVLGAKRETLLSDEDKRVVAYHESGHALMAHLCPNADPLDKVTIGIERIFAQNGAEAGAAGEPMEAERETG